MDAFRDVFLEYVDRLDCTSKALSSASGLSPVVISRYRSGDRTPLKNSPQFQKLVHGLALLCEEKGFSDTESQIYETLEAALPHYDSEIPPDAFRQRLILLAQKTGIPMSHMAKALSYDPSYLSKICSGQRFPSSPMVFQANLCQYVASQYTTPASQQTLAASLGFEYPPRDLPEEEWDFSKALFHWFNSINE